MGHARLYGQRPDGSWKWCVFPCQKLGADGQRIARECRVPLHQVCDREGQPAKRADGTVWPVWVYTGPPDAPTLSPSVDCDDKPCWHGFIQNGEIK